MASDKLDLSIVVPTYKEAGNIRPLVERIFQATTAAGLSAELIIVDDDSGDGTDESCAALAHDHNVRLITRQRERGLAAAVLLGFREARGRFLLSMDADLSHPPQSIPDFARALGLGLPPSAQLEDWEPPRPPPCRCLRPPLRLLCSSPDRVPTSL